MKTRERRLRRILRVLVACFVFMLVRAPAPAFGAVDLALQGRAAATVWTAASIVGARRKAADTTPARASAGRRAAPRPTAALVRVDIAWRALRDPTSALAGLVRVPRKYLRHCSLLC